MIAAAKLARLLDKAAHDIVNDVRRCEGYRLGPRSIEAIRASVANALREASGGGNLRQGFREEVAPSADQHPGWEEEDTEPGMPSSKHPKPVR
jgi:hypothetical protein